jgi:hypothetical protein
MQVRKARQILEALIQGVDPHTGEAPVSASVFQHADVLRALLAGSAALQAAESRAARRAQLPTNVGLPWDSEEEATLLAAFRSGTPVETLAQTHGRTTRAIQLRLAQLGAIATTPNFLNGGHVGEPTDSPPRSRSRSDGTD